MKTKSILLSLGAVLGTGLCLLAGQSGGASADRLALVPVAGAVVAGNKKTVPSVVKEATIFFGGAEVTHTSQVGLSRGENEVVIEGLSPHIDLNSLKIKVSAAAMVASYEFSHDYLTASKGSAPEIVRLQEAIETKAAEFANVEVEQSINSNMLEYLKAGIAKNVSGSEQGLGVDELVKTMDYYKKKAGELEGARLELEKKKKNLQEEITSLRNQLDQETGRGNKVAGVLKLNLASEAEANVVLTVSYFTGSAGWTPYYDINVDATDKPVVIAGKSKVWQNTGLDWEKVKLTLSTSLPNNGRTAPVLSPWFLHPQNVYADQGRPRMYDMAAEVAADEEVLMMSKQAMAKPVPAPSMANHINVSENQLNVTYDIDIPYTIPGNGKVQNIDLLKKETPAEYRYYASPKLDQRVYLVAEIADWQNMGLLSGSANVTYDGTYVGETYIDGSSTDEKLLLTLGSDPRVSLKREKLQDYSSKRLLGSDTEQTFTYRITVKNNQKVAVKIEVKDQYPISTQKDIVVSLRSKETTPWSKDDEATGVLTWEDELQAGQSKAYDISYSVKYPKGTRLNL